MAEDRLGAYVPGLLADWLRCTPAARFRVEEGTLVLIDIAGFTALTERLARSGRVGAEQTSELLSSVFTDLLRIAASHGGRLVKWGGDALLLLFEGDQDAVAAACAAWRMRGAVQRPDRASATSRPGRLQVSVGVYSGQVELFVVGTVHRELIVAGASASRVVRLQAAAATGQILVGPATARLLGPTTVGDHGVLLRRPSGDLRQRRTATSSGEMRASRPWGVDRVALGGPPTRGGVPKAIRDRLDAGPLEGEHRRVAIGFVEFSGVAALRRQHGRGGVWKALQDLVGLAQEACDRWEVTFVETDVSVDGGKILLVAGAPRSPGHDGERLVHALQAILDYSGPLRVRCGANAGRVFAGGFGPPEQRTYSVKGDAVNLAARVMGHARTGQLLATPAVLGPGSGTFTGTPLPAFRVKGKSDLVHAVEIGEARHPRVRSDGETAFIGRQSELHALRELGAAARDGHGHGVLICGPSGIGKSRLTAELATDATGLRVVSVGCDQAGADTAYALFDTLLRDLLGVPDPASDAVVARVLAEVMRRDAPQLLPRLPLLGTVLRVDLPSTAETESLADEFRVARLEDLLVDLVNALLPGPTLLVVDDAQLADAASAAVLVRLLRGVADRPWLVLLTGTDDLTGPDEQAWADDLACADDNVQRMHLGPLDDADVARLLRQSTRGTPLLPHQREALIDRAAGNPLFLRELLPLAGTVERAADLPESVEEVLAAEIDRLAPPDRRVLRAAAAGGMRVDVALLTEALGEPLPPQMWERLAGLVDPDHEGQLRFRHTLVREVAYQGLSYRRRRLLHDALGRALQRRAGAAFEEHAEALALHFFNAENYPAAAHYARIAGERAASAYANAEAEAALSRALDAARHMQPAAPEEVARLAEACGDIRCRLGEFAAATADYRAARRARRDDAVTVARLDLKTAQVVAHTVGFSRALAWVTRGRHVLTGATDPEAQREDARLLVQYALMRQQQGRYDDADRACRAATAAAARAGSRDVLAQAWQLLDAADVARGRFDDEPWAQRALTIWQERGDLAWQARAQNQVGIRAYFTGSWNDALSHYRGAADAFGRVGDQWNAAIASCNVGEILADQGRPVDAQHVIGPAAEVLRASGALSESAFALSLLGRTALRAGRHDDAERLLASARASYVRAGERLEIVAIDLRLAECLLAQRRHVEAVTVTDRLDSEALDPASRTTLDWLRGHALAQQGRFVPAADAFLAGLTAARERGARYDELLAVDALVRLDTVCRRVPDPENVAVRTALAGRLGVVAVPALPQTTPERRS